MSYGQEILTELQKHESEFCHFIQSTTKNGYVKFTTKLKEIVSKIGESKGFTVRHSGQNNKELLYDLAWLKEEKSNNFLLIKSMPLVLESEISKKGVDGFKEDFDKLLFANNSYKIMVFTKVKKHDFDNIMSYSQKAIDSLSYFKSGDFIDLIYFDEADEGIFSLVKVIKT